MGAGPQRASGGRRGRAALFACTAALVALASVGGLLAANRGGDTVAAETNPVAVPALSPAKIYPSLISPLAPPRPPDWAELFVSGQTLAQVVTPTCPRYAATRRMWWRRGKALRADSIGADASPKAAARYYAAVVWVSQDEAGEFREAITRISRSRVSAATRGDVKRGFVVNAFTHEALELCGLTDRVEQTYRRLDGIDQRIARIIALARLNSRSGTEVNAAQ